MKKMFVTALAVCLYQISASAAAVAAAPAASAASAPTASAPAPITPAGYDVPAECKNLALMAAELVGTSFHDSQMSGHAHNPSTLTLRTDAGLQITKVEYLGGDSEDPQGPNAGKYPCDLDSTLCTTPGDAGGAVDYARVSVEPTAQAKIYGSAQVVVSYGSRGGCVIDSVKNGVQ